MSLRTLSAGPIETNAYLLTSPSGEAFLVDCPPDVAPMVEAALKETATRLAAILLTHGHWDHIGDLGRLQRDGVPVYAHSADREWIENPDVMAAFMPPGLSMAPGTVDRLLEHGERLTLGGEEVEVRHVPGHAPGNVLFYFPGRRAAFVGDVIFKGGVGRFDLPGGDWKTLERSVREQVFTLPDETELYSGHGPPTTVGAEKRSNPFVRAGA